ncbi:hypothetical protein [Lentilactobacillus sp. Marseille-Q4993]|uniref:hypothetical protein n=1 Tax=Lentilactobacillus sp. Marseille-Q4993 TaxID=3039492 RepID=UPI0024BBF528|nr:hypothetical protein [Lentilactobacillus sp. Marseille-Q4993]
MQNKDDKPQYKKYDFSEDDSSRRQKRNNFRGWWFAVLILVVAVMIALGISWFQQSAGKQHEKGSSDKSPITKTIKKKLDHNEESHKVESFESRLSKANNDGLTSQQRSSFQSEVDNEKDSSVKQDEQSILNETPSKTIPNKKPAKPKVNSSADQFTQPHTFASISDARNWAQATKADWLRAGYNNFTITTNGQGYYTLTFVK